MTEQKLPTTGKEAVERMEAIFARNGYKKSQAENVVLFTCNSPNAFQMALLYEGDHGFELTHPEFNLCSWNCGKCFWLDNTTISASKFFENMENLVLQASHTEAVR